MQPPVNYENLMSRSYSCRSRLPVVLIVFESHTHAVKWQRKLSFAVLDQCYNNLFKAQTVVHTYTDISCGQLKQIPKTTKPHSEEKDWYLYFMDKEGENVFFFFFIIVV